MTAPAPAVDWPPTAEQIAWVAEHDPDLYAEIVAVMEADLQEIRAAEEASEARRQMSARWGAEARAEQIPPDGAWFVWLILAGRGWGKTRTGAEWAAAMGRRYPGARIALVAPTAADGRDTMVEGESGLLSVIADAELRGGSRDKGWNRSLGELFLANGTRFKVFSAEKPGRLRGPQHHFVWADEPAAWADAARGAKASPSRDVTWSNLVIGARNKAREDWPAGFQPRIVATTTPKLVRLLKVPDSELTRDPTVAGLMQQPHVTVTHGRTAENLANLAETYIETVVRPLEGTRLGRQELDAILLEDVEGALWAASLIDEGRIATRADLDRVGSADYVAFWQRTVVALDPSDGTDEGDEQGLAVVGLGSNHELYVLASEGLRVTPWDYLNRAVDVATEYAATIVMEKNHGSEYLVGLFEQVLRKRGVRVPYKVVTANPGRGKMTRAEPVAGLYERGKVHHVGEFPELEAQMTSWTGKAGEKSPDRLDALVWALSEFTGYALTDTGDDDAGAVATYDGFDALTTTSSGW